MSKAISAAFACVVCMSLGLVPMFMGTFPVFLQPVSAELGWGAAVFPQSALVAGTVGALAGPLIGHCLDRFGVRPIMMIGLTGWTASLFVLSLLDGSKLQLFLVAGVMGITACACGPIALAKVVAGWFDRNRGLAMGVVLSAAPAVATAIMVVIASACIARFGWRISYRLFAVLVLCVAIPIAALWMREAPVTEALRSTPAGVKVGGRRAAFQALGSQDFWMLMLLTGLTCGAVQALLSHFVAFSAERGVSNAVTTAALSTFSLVGPAGPLLAGALADRMDGPKSLASFYALPLAGLALMIVFGAPAVVPAMALLGLGFSAATGMLPYLLTRYFGVEHASQLFGVGLGVVTLAMGLGPVVLGLARDRFGTFSASLPALFALLIAGLAISLLMRNYSPRKRPDPVAREIAS
jgi:MFS family permease